MYLETLAACEVAGIEPFRLNQHIFDGHFKAAPPTRPGRARRFTPDDLLALCLFQDLMVDGLKAGVAGRIAGIVAATARLDRGAAAVSVIRYHDMGGRWVGTSCNSENALKDDAAAYMMTFNICELRNRVSEAFQHHRKESAFRD